MPDTTRSAGRPPLSPLGAKRTVAMKLSPEAIATLARLATAARSTKIAVVERLIFEAGKKISK